MPQSPDDGQAIALTRELLNRRSRRYRDLVIAVAVVGLAVPIAVLVVGEWRILLAWLLTIPMVGFFLVLDAWAVASWRSRLLDGWVAGTIDLDALVEGFTSIKMLPARTIASLIAGLPTRARLECFPDPKPLIREALATMVRAIDRLLLNRLIASVAALTIASVLVALAAALGSLWPLVAVPIVYGIGQVAQHLSFRPPRGWANQLADWKGGGLDVKVFVQLAGRLGWEPLPVRIREKWLSIGA